MNKQLLLLIMLNLKWLIMLVSASLIVSCYSHKKWFRTYFDFDIMYEVSDDSNTLLFTFEEIWLTFLCLSLGDFCQINQLL